MMQPVYLNAPGVRRVTLEGQALKIHSRDVADRFFPLQRLGRIISRGSVQWSTPALLQCMKMGIPVTFLDDRGQAVGICYSAWTQYSSLSELLDSFFTTDSGPQKLVDWFRSYSRTSLLKLLHAHDLHPADLRVRTVRRYLRLHWGSQYGSTAAPVSPMKPLLTAHILEILTSYRIAPELLEPGHEWAGLVTYVTGVEEWDLWHLALNGRLKINGSSYKAIVSGYQHHAPWMERRIRNLVGKLWRWLEHGEAYT